MKRFVSVQNDKKNTDADGVGSGSATPINILSVDAEGFDADVLLGAGADVLQRVEYFEFEYNWGWEAGKVSTYTTSSKCWMGII